MVIFHSHIKLHQIPRANPPIFQQNISNMLLYPNTIYGLHHNPLYLYSTIILPLCLGEIIFTVKIQQSGEKNVRQNPW
jgi:hypothetical protein